MSTANSLGVRRFDAAYGVVEAVTGEVQDMRATRLYVGDGKDRLGDWVITTSGVVSGDTGLANSLLFRQCTTAKTGSTSAVYTTRSIMTQ